jgi:O-acetyl-ADP-ribose deacetylase (regulator of RNase III)
MEAGFGSIAFPTIGAGTGGVGREKALGFVLDEIERSGTPLRVVVVEYKPVKK